MPAALPLDEAALRASLAGIGFTADEIEAIADFFARGHDRLDYGQVRVLGNGEAFDIKIRTRAGSWA